MAEGRSAFGAGAGTLSARSGSSGSRTAETRSSGTAIGSRGALTSP